MYNYLKMSIIKHVHFNVDAMHCLGFLIFRILVSIFYISLEITIKMFTFLQNILLLTYHEHVKSYIVTTLLFAYIIGIKVKLFKGTKSSTCPKKPFFLF